MRTQWFVAVLGATLLVAGQGCDDSGPTGPDAGPIGFSASTALQNLAIVKGLEHEQRPGSGLIGISGECGTDGRLLRHSAWRYTFRDAVQDHAWLVPYDGNIFFAGSSLPPPRRASDVEPFLVLDSPELVRIALEAGGSAFLQGRTATRITIGLAADPAFTLPPMSGTCAVFFEDLLTLDLCQFLLDSQTGEVRSIICR